ncbi:MAG: ATP-binding protein [Azonexus sp.]|nr:ATP-binding protein [Azonexus sp.]
MIVGLSIVLVWAAAAYELYRSRQNHLHGAEVRTVVQAHVFAEYSRSTIKRINEFILDLRPEWTGDWKSFSNSVQRRQENIDDLTFQVAIIDRDGILAYSNLAKPTDRTDLSQREHFKVHQEAGNADRLFISRPLKGKVSGKWSIQITRPILKNGKFDGVLVVSVSPEQFASFAEKLRIAQGSSLTVVRNTGEIMARYPAIESSLGKLIEGRPFLRSDEADSGNYSIAATVDGKERIFGYYRLPEYGMNFVLGEAENDVLVPYFSHRRTVILGAIAVSILALSLFFMLFRSLSTLESVQRQLDAIFSLSPDGFVSFDAEHRVKYISPTFSRMTGLEESDIAGLDEDAFADRLAKLCVENARSFSIASMRAAHNTGNGEDNSGSRQLIELASAGKRVLEVGLRLSEAKMVSQILYFRDVTHETEVDRLKSEFLSTAAHELRTPMASIFGYSELMLSQEFPEEERHELLGIIHRQSELMVSIINELLDLVRIEERRGKDFNLSRIEAGELLREIIANFKTIDGTTPPAAPSPESQHWLRVDRKKLTQAVTNVLSNAYKYSPNGGAVEIELLEASDEEHSGQIGIRITDHGIGMTPEQLARVCERFYRADTSGKIPGTGLGMSIVKEIIELHGGKVSLGSKMGSGTSVTLWIPKT